MPLSTSTERFVSIENIKDDCLILKDGSLRAVLMVSGINFDLKSEEEQELITVAYQSLLNRLDFPLQIVVHSRKLNLDLYLKKIKEREEQEENPLLRSYIRTYHTFIQELLATSNIMSKRFYIVVPYTGGVSLQTSVSRLAQLLPLPGKKTTTKEETNDFETQKLQLQHRVNAIIAALRPMEIKAVRLKTAELLELFYNLYNPEKIERAPLKVLEELKEVEEIEEELR